MKIDVGEMGSEAVRKFFEGLTYSNHYSIPQTWILQGIFDFLTPSSLLSNPIMNTVFLEICPYPALLKQKG